MVDFPVDELRKWFLHHKRVFPWREQATPYSVWVSEVMLQQTQAACVVPYFTRWMEAFPTIEILAKAPIEKVIKLWEGLGYYSRARNLHEGAKVIIQKFGGKLPYTVKELSSIKGLGPYTVGAVLSFGFKKKKAAVDGNVLRVLSRFFAIEESIELSQTQKKIWSLAETLLPDERPFEITEALIELGATVCQKRAQCSICPIASSCQAKRENMVTLLPKRGKREKITVLYRQIAVMVRNDQTALITGDKGKLMAELFQFPFVETTKEGVDPKNVVTYFKQTHSMNLNLIRKLPIQKMSFTTYRAHLFPFLFETQDQGPFMWVKRKRLYELPFSSGHKRILNTLS